MRQKIIFFMLFFGSIVFSTILVEIFLRKFNITPPIFRISINQSKFSEDPLLGYELIPNFEDINSDGFRSPPIPINKAKNTIRLAMLGDSISFGCCNIPISDTMSEQLISELNRNSSSQAKYDIINAGILGYNTIQEAELFKTKVKKYQPNIILWQLTISNDHLPMTFEYDSLLLAQKDKNSRSATFNFYKLAARSNQKLYSLYSYRYLLYAITFIQSQIENKLKTDQSLLNNLPVQEKFDFLSIVPLINEKEQNNSWTESNIIPEGFKLLKQSIDYPIRIIVIIVPDFKYNLLEYSQVMINRHSDVIQWAKNNNFETIDLLGCYQQFLKTNPIRLDIGDRVHPNSIGHKIASQCIYNYLTNKKP